MKTEIINPADLPVSPAGPPPGAREAERMRQLFDDAQAGTLRIVAFGLYAWWQKSRLKHGQFIPWCKHFLPDLSYRTICSYMGVTRSALEGVGYQIGTAMPVSLGGELLLTERADLPPESSALREALHAILHGKTKRELMGLRFKTCEVDADGNLRAVTGAGKRHPREPRDLEKDAARAREQADAALDDLAGRIRLVKHDSALLAYSSRGARTRYLQASQSLNSLITDLQKSAAKK